MKALRCCLADPKPTITEVEVTSLKLHEDLYLRCSDGYTPAAYLYRIDQKKQLEMAIEELLYLREKLRTAEHQIYNRTRANSKLI